MIPRPCINSWEGPGVSDVPGRDGAGGPPPPSLIQTLGHLPCPDPKISLLCLVVRGEGTWWVRMQTPPSWLSAFYRRRPWAHLRRPPLTHSPEPPLLLSCFMDIAAEPYSASVTCPRAHWSREKTGDAWVWTLVRKAWAWPRGRRLDRGAVGSWESLWCLHRLCALMAAPHPLLQEGPRGSVSPLSWHWFSSGLETFVYS